MSKYWVAGLQGRFHVRPGACRSGSSARLQGLDALRDHQAPLFLSVALRESSRVYTSSTQGVRPFLQIISSDHHSLADL